MGGGAQTHLCPPLLKVRGHVPPLPPFSYALGESQCWLKYDTIGEAHAKYESPISNGTKVMGNVNFFQKKVKGHDQGHMFKIHHRTIGNVMFYKTHDGVPKLDRGLS